MAKLQSVLQVSGISEHSILSVLQGKTSQAAKTRTSNEEINAGFYNVYKVQRYPEFMVFKGSGK